ncbi:alpha/beta fold hydrolase [Thiomicrospira cyclica]|uniref:Alpha/beta hydrolase fold protein n=1 Tax=Thiomicrospira cyclica (strain DSM 14477 / JCM 11371 / ALM1) TaxID=717773 RepID=F6DAR0_THICA|nr:alpha/beta hydrolase [Thiomicrospira cyclica]AEG31153.1 alpha/beta hydrolase fold protein [Thiomicrospira cyclica ALM1]
MKIVLLSGCAQIPTQKTMITDRQVEFIHQDRQGDVTIVFENGLTSKLTTWQGVLPLLPDDVNYLVYNRADYGRSEPSDQPRTGKFIVAELRELLAQQQIEPPYLLVGHSLGGLYAQYFARSYADELAGLLLVDSVHPTQMENRGAYENWNFFSRLGFNIFTSSTEKAELFGLTTTGQAVLAKPNPKQLPIIILVAGQDYSRDQAARNHVISKRKDLAKIYPQADWHQVDSGHTMQRQRPDIVADAIIELIEKHRKNAFENNL